jgi:transposase
VGTRTSGSVGGRGKRSGSKDRHRAFGLPNHLVKLATDALDDIRREVWSEARRAGQKQLAKELKGARFALWKNPGNLTERQQLKLARVQQLNQRLYRAYLIAQQLRQIYRVPIDHAIAW